MKRFTSFLAKLLASTAITLLFFSAIAKFWWGYLSSYIEGII